MCDICPRRSQPGSNARGAGVGHRRALPLRSSRSDWRTGDVPTSQRRSVARRARRLWTASAVASARDDRTSARAMASRLRSAGPARPEHRRRRGRNCVSPGRSSFAEVGHRELVNRQRLRVLLAERPASAGLVAQLAQDRGQGGAVGRGEPVEDPFRLAPAGFSDGVQDLRAVLGQLDQRGPPVVRIGPAPG
jgi:hypothetical protein